MGGQEGTEHIRGEMVIQHIGIVACTAQGAALCYRTICSEGEFLMGKHAHPEVTMHTYSLHKYLRLIEKDDWGGIAALLASSSEKVAKAGADFIVCPNNTVHHVFDEVFARSPRPWLHIAEEVAEEAVRCRYQQVGVLGTRSLMEGSVYASKFEALNLEHRIPSLGERIRVSEIILSELIRGRFTIESRSYLAGVIGRMQQEGCDAVVLGCTELPLLIAEADSPLPLLDSTRILARAALWRAASMACSS
jgi:aspartate racemase